MCISGYLATHVRLLQHWCCESDKDHMYLCVHGFELHQSYTEVTSSGLVSVLYRYAPRTAPAPHAPRTQGSLRCTYVHLSQNPHTCKALATLVLRIR